MVGYSLSRRNEKLNQGSFRDKWKKGWCRGCRAQTLFKNKGLIIQDTGDTAKQRVLSCQAPLPMDVLSFWAGWYPVTDYCGGLKTPTAYHSSGQL